MDDYGTDIVRRLVRNASVADEIGENRAVTDNVEESLSSDSLRLACPGL
jgi:hypothetical protein